MRDRVLGVVFMGAIYVGMGACVAALCFGVAWFKVFRPEVAAVCALGFEMSIVVALCCAAVVGVFFLGEAVAVHMRRGGK